MGKKTITGTKNVYELAQERLKVIFNEFEFVSMDKKWTRYVKMYR